jgi:autotransporter adhesin
MSQSNQLRSLAMAVRGPATSVALMAGVAFGALALTAAPAAAQVVCEDVGTSTGQGATAGDAHSTACGPGASAVGTASTAAGGAQAIGNYSFAGGYLTHADGVGSVGIGGFVAVPVVGGTANGTTLADDYGVAVGSGASASVSGITIGGPNQQSGDYIASHSGGLDIYFSESRGNYSTALGAGAEAGWNPYAVGGLGIVDNATAVGAGTIAAGASSVALGGAETISEFGIPETGAATATFGSNGVALGAGAQVTSIADYGVAIGGGAVSNQSGAIAIGGREDLGIFGTAPTTASGAQSIAIGQGTGASGASSIAVGAGAAATKDNSVALGSDSVTERGASASYTAYGLTGSQASQGEVSVGVVADPTPIFGHAALDRQITNVAAGSEATDAVNVSQLNAVAQNTAAALGGGAAYDATTGAYTAPSFLAGAGGASYSTVADALAHITSGGAGSDTSAVHYDGPTHTTLTLSGAGGTTVTNVKAGAVTSSSTDAVNGAQLYAVGQTADTALANANTALANGAYFRANATGPGPQATGANSIAAGPNSKAEAASSVAIGDGATALGGKATSIGAGNTASGDGAVAIGDPNTATGLGAVAIGANNAATGQGAVALGNASAATGRSALAEGDGAIATGASALALGQGASASVANSAAIGAGAVAARGAQADYTAVGVGGGQNSAGEVSVGSAGAERQITNVAAGSAPTDAVNVSQLQAVANDFDAQLDRLSHTTRREINSGSAVSNALSGIPQAVTPGSGFIGAAVGGYGDATAVAVGLSKMTGGAHPMIFKAGVSFDTRGDQVGYHVGAGYSF